MIVGALLLVLIGAADIARSTLGPGPRRGPVALVAALVAVVWAAVLVLAATGLGVPLGWLAVPLVVALGWLITTSASAGPGSGPRSRFSRARALPAVAVVVALVASLFWDPLPGGPSGYLVDALAAVPIRALASLPVVTVVLAVGLALFLVESANIVVRSALRPAMEEVRGVEGDASLTSVGSEAGATATAAVPAAAAPVRWWSRRRRTEAVVSTPVVEDLRGGRIIGPLERLLIVALSLAGALPIVAGILAAKGIVRFPEISHDGPGGSKAEYFLVGSLVSWSLAILSAGALWISTQS
ncbi:hypothetical protein ACEXQD_11690 [Herbiconiux sp. P15]|uniref:hypothetical protein n=1 Tax=Herbiconiux liukaitaii TaxID=3342799 RepID=UPI0035BB5693